jgi:RNA polymerase sigma-70 factor (sigma-E family)
MGKAAEREFHDFVVERSGALAGLARLLAADHDAAEDLLQVALLRAWRSWRRVRQAEAPEAYFRKIMVNAAVSGWRRGWRAELPASPLPEVPAADQYSAVADRDYLIRAVRGLPPRQRAAVVLRYFSDLDDAEIADALGCSVSTVRSQISRALTSLRVAADAATVPVPGEPSGPRRRPS